MRWRYTHNFDTRQTYFGRGWWADEVGVEFHELDWTILQRGRVFWVCRDTDIIEAGENRDIAALEPLFVFPSLAAAKAAYLIGHHVGQCNPR